MRITRIILVVVSILSVGLFAISELNELIHRDASAPRIESEQDVAEIPCSYTREDLMQGISAWDDEEGDLTSKVITGAFSRFIEKGVSSLTYVVFDSADRSASLTRKVRFTDYHSPRFTLSEPLVFVEKNGTYDDVLSRLGATDVLDGDRKDWIVCTESDVNYQLQGTYTISFEVENSFGDSSSVDLPVHIVSSDDGQPDIRLTQGIVYITQGETLDPASYIASVTAEDGSVMDPSAVTVSSGVDVNTPGCYEVYYRTSGGESPAGETWLTVIVEAKEGQDE